MGPVTVPIQQTVRLVGFGEKFLARAEVSQDQPESNYSSYQFIIVGFYGCSAWVIENSSDPPGDRLILSWPLVRIVNQIHKRCFFSGHCGSRFSLNLSVVGAPKVYPLPKFEDCTQHKWGCSLAKVGRSATTTKMGIIVQSTKNKSRWKHI